MKTIPKLTSWHTAEAISRAQEASGEEPSYWRRIAWGSTPVKWYFYRGGLWFKITSGDPTNPQIVQAADMTEEDFLGLDWTTLGEGCIDATVDECSTLDEFFIDGFYRSETDAEAILDFDNPNAGECGDECAPPEIPLGFDEEGGTDGGGAGGGSAGGGGEGGGGASFSGIGGRRRPRRVKPPFNGSLTITDVSHDIPDCLPTVEGDAAPVFPYPYNLFTANVNLSDPDNPSDVWFVKVFFKGELIENTTAKHGDTIGVVFNKLGVLPWCHSHGIRAHAWKANHTMTATHAVKMTSPCDNYGNPMACPVALDDVDVL